MFKKLASLVLAVTMMSSVAVITASAAETDEDAAVAAGESAAVAADDSSAVGADASSETGAGNTISFDVNSSGWGNVKTVFAHVWRADGTGTWPAWQGKAEKCTYDTSSGVATYDLSKTGNDIKSSDGAVYCVIFSAQTGMQTYNAIMSGACIGDTLKCTGKELENPEDSEKTATEATWIKNANLGPEKKITSTGHIIGNAYPEGSSDITMMADYLVAYYNDPAKTEKSLVQGLFDTLGKDLYTIDVFNSASDKLGKQIDDGKVTKEEATEKLKAVSTILNNVTGHEKPDAPTIPADPTPGATVSAGSTGSGSSSNGSSSSSGSGSSSVKSGQETTVFFVFGGLMIAATGAMFMARRKKED